MSRDLILRALAFQQSIVFLQMCHFKMINIKSSDDYEFISKATIL